MPDHHVEIVGRKQTRPTYVATNVCLCGSDAYVATNVSNRDVGIAPTKSQSRVGRATALSLPDHHAEIVGRKQTRPTYVATNVYLCGSDAYVATNVSNRDVGIAPTKSQSRVGRVTALSLPDHHAEIVRGKETRPTCLSGKA